MCLELRAAPGGPFTTLATLRMLPRSIVELDASCKLRVWTNHSILPSNIAY